MAGLLVVERCLLHCPHYPSVHSRRLLRRAGACFDSLQTAIQQRALPATHHESQPTCAGAASCALRRTPGCSGWTTRCGLASIFGRKKRGGKNKKRPQRNALDTTMAWGDIMTLLATQLVCLCASPVATNTHTVPIAAIRRVHLPKVYLAWKERLRQCKTVVKAFSVYSRCQACQPIPVPWCTAGQPPDGAGRRAGERAGAGVGGHGHG